MNNDDRLASFGVKRDNTDKNHDDASAKDLPAHWCRWDMLDNYTNV